MSHDLEVTPGIYQHYKGGTYRVLLIATESTNAREGNKAVIYISLKDGLIHYRDLKEFTELVVWPDGGKKPRFIGVYTSFKNPTRKR